MTSISINGSHKSFHKNHVLKGISLDINESGIWAILGPNASGKTTLIKSILGMVLPDNGRIIINDKNVLGEWKYKSKLNYLPQIARFPDNLTVNELFKMIEELRNEKGDLLPLITKFDPHSHLKTKLSNLSGGTRQKVNLALALMYDNPIYIFDEPTAGLDPVALIELKNTLLQLKNAGRLIIITTHIISLVEEIADKIVFLLEGEIRFNGNIKQLKKVSGEKKLEAAIAALISHNSQK